MLESITLYKNFGRVSGFEVTFQPHPNLSGWQPETQLFGEKITGTDVTGSFDTEITDL